MRESARADCAGLRGGSPVRAGFTLLELTLSLVLVTTIGLGLGSAIVLASRAIPMEDSNASRAIAQAEALDVMLSEIGDAEMIVERGKTAIGMVLADRNGDGMGDLVRYAWDGNAGRPLTRSVNGGTAEVVVEAIDRLSLDYESGQDSEFIAGAETDGTEFVLGARESGGESTHVLDGVNSVGFSMLPSLPAGTSAWRVTRVQTRMAKRYTSSGTLEARLEPASADWMPTGEVLASQSVSESSLSDSLSWYEFPLRSPALSAGSRVALTLHDTGAGEAGGVGYVAGVGTRSTDAMLVHDDDGWGVEADNALFFRAYGATITRGADIGVARQRVRGVRIELDSLAAWRTRSACLNEPEIVERRWDLTFDHVPTGLDRDRDGQSDWKVSGGFDGASLTDGVWSATQSITTCPTFAFGTTTTIDLRLRDDTDNGEGGARVIARVDVSSGQLASIELRVMRRGGLQWIELRCGDSPSSVKVLGRTTVDHVDFVDVRMTILPESDAVNLRVDDVDIGTFRYAVIASGLPGGVTLEAFGADSGARFDDVSIRVSPAP